MATKPKPDPPTPLSSIEDEDLRNLLAAMGDEAARRAGEIELHKSVIADVNARMAELATAAGLRRIKADDWSFGPQGWRNETFRKERLLQQGWDLTCPHCQGEITVTTPLAAIEKAVDVRAGVAWSVRRKAEKPDKSSKETT